jgi:hypothetical protein
MVETITTTDELQNYEGEVTGWRRRAQSEDGGTS